MKKVIYADIKHIPSETRSAVQTAKVLLSVAGAIAMIGVAMALSQDTERTRVRYFLNDGSIVQAERIRGVTYKSIEEHYLPVPSQHAAEPEMSPEVVSTADVAQAGAEKEYTETVTEQIEQE